MAGPKGEGRRARAGGASVLEARWAGDGAHVLYVSTATGRPQAYRTDAAGEQVTQLTDDPEGVRQPQQAADGTLAYVALRSARALEEYSKLSQEERLARKGTLDRVDLVVARAGRTDVVARDVVVHDYGLSADGRAVAYGTTGKLVIAEVDTGNRREFTLTQIDPQLTAHALGPIVWRPDGRALLFRAAFLGGRSERDGQPSTLSVTPPTSGSVPPAWPTAGLRGRRGAHCPPDASPGRYLRPQLPKPHRPVGTDQLGVLLSSGLIVGESLLGVAFAAVVAFSGRSSSLALVGEGFLTPSIWIGGLAFVATAVVMYRWIERLGRA